jgi:hypothetical protein
MMPPRRRRSDLFASFNRAMGTSSTPPSPSAPAAAIASSAAVASFSDASCHRQFQQQILAVMFATIRVSLLSPSMRGARNEKELSWMK